MRKNVFLKAEWRKLAVANYEVDPKVLQKYLPNKTELDLWNDTCYVSLVGFMFLNTKVKGIAIPFHSNFEEVNLRFYVKHKDFDGNWKRGVVFIKELVPKPAVTFIANTLYKENYQTLPMKHFWEFENSGINVSYHWKHMDVWNSIKIEAENIPSNIMEGSEQEFILEHYWGYAKINENSTSEYEVEHPKWEIYQVKNYDIQINFGNLYGNEFENLNSEKPKSVFLAEGSEIYVRDGIKF